ncbi:hypothetical protein [Streptosporangium sp. NPDC048865]|uniref:hypothetical protein n=1 Tax=Streptosporangium sp. NPDC048865 TaxID=3155766 RepID=UPI00341FF3E3
MRAAAGLERLEANHLTHGPAPYGGRGGLAGRTRRRVPAFPRTRLIPCPHRRTRPGGLTDHGLAPWPATGPVSPPTPPSNGLEVVMRLLIHPATTC